MDNYDTIKNMYWDFNTTESGQIIFKYKVCDILALPEANNFNKKWGFKEFKTICFNCKTEYTIPKIFKSRNELLMFNSYNPKPCIQCELALQRKEELIKIERIHENALELNKHRTETIKKHGKLFTNELCTSCQNGFLLIKFSALNTSPFLSCSRFNPHRNSCTFTKSIASEKHEYYINIINNRPSANHQIQI